MGALADATRKAVRTAGVAGDASRGDRARHHRIERHSRGRRLAAARRLLPLVRPPRQGRSGRDHRRRAREGLEAIDWCGGVYSSEWGFAKLLHWLRHNPDKRDRFVTASSTATWWRPCSAASPIPRRCRAASARWATSGCGTRRSAGCRPRVSWSKVDPLLAGVREKLDGATPPPTRSPGTLAPRWAEQLGLRAGHPDSGRRLRRALGRDRRRSARRATWSTWSAPPPASWRSRQPGEPDSRRLRRGAGLRASADTRASRPGSRRPATSSRRSRAAPASTVAELARAWRTTAPARPDCCA